jgi:hypothetical protein
MGGPEEVQVLRFSFPYFRLEKKIVDKPRMNLAGRTVLHPIEVDFEDIENPIDCCLWIEEVRGHYVKNRVPIELDFEGVVYTFYGLFPLQHLRDNVWSCSIDHMEINK